MDEIIRYASNAIKKLNFEFPYAVNDWVSNRNMLMENYHRHTTWSNLIQIDSATGIDDFMKIHKEYGCQLYFSTEHGYQGQWIKVYDECQKDGNLKFRYGAEVYWVKDLDEIIQEEYTDKNGECKIREKKDDTNCHMVIIARTYEAMRKLNYIISCAHEHGFYRKPRIDLQQLFTLSPDDVYITSACIAGWKYEDATEIWINIWRHFGNSFFLEYQANNTEEQKNINKRIYCLHKELGIQTIAGLDTHYLNNEDRIKRDNLLKRKGISYPEENGWYMDFPTGKEFYNRMLEQGVVSEEDIIYSMMNTHVFVNGCEELEYDREFKIPIRPDLADKTYDERCEILREQLLDAFNKEDASRQTDDRKQAIDYELEQYKLSGTADYALSNSKVVQLAIEKYGGHLTTTSRGSASSFYTSKLLGFTTMDRFDAEVPIYPERFITKERIIASHQMPDIDLNCSEQEPFVKASRELFGEHGCYPLLAVGTLGEKSGFKLYADINGIEPSVANEISKNIDKYNEALKQAEDDEDRESIRIENYIKDKQLLKVFNDSKPYQGIIEQAKVHACGFMLFNGSNNNTDIIGYGDIRYEIGLIRCVSKTGNSTIVANIEGGMLDAFGYVKSDFLIVDVVSIIYELYHALGMEVPTVSKLREMVSGDKQTWDLYANGITCCLNQCEKSSTTKKVMTYKPQNIKELAAFIAGIRPGFKSHVDNFLNRIPYTNGEKPIDDMLKDSFKYMIYQESVMSIFSFLGIPMKDAYDTIKKISKKKLKGEALKKVENTLREHWLKNIGNLDNFEPVYQVIKDSARYAFNSPHALAMANDSLYEAWMKAHYPSIFYEVTLNHYQNKDDKNKVAELLKEAKNKMGYEIGHYEYGKDNSKFTVDDKQKIIYPNMASIKGIGKAAVEDMMKIYDKGLRNIIDIYLSIKGTSINGTMFRKMIMIGYFRSLGTVKQLLKTVDLIDELRTNGSYKKVISKKNMPDYLKGIDLNKYCTDLIKDGKHSDSRYKITNWRGLVGEICSKISNEEYHSATLGKMQYDILGYVETKDPNLDWRFVIVTDLNTTFSPKFQGYCIKTGQVQEFKIHKRRNLKQGINTSFNDTPVATGDVIYMKKCSKELAMKKVDDKWVTQEGVYVWWVNDYYKPAI